MFAPIDPPALHSIDPDLFNVTARFVRRYPSLRSAAWRGAALARGNHFAEALDATETNVVAVVKSATAPATRYYEITWGDAELRCNCPSWSENAALGPHGAPLCKHLIGYVLLAKLDRPLQSALPAATLWSRLRAQLKSGLQAGTWRLLWERIRLDDAASSPQRLTLVNESRIVAAWLNTARWQRAVAQMACEIAGRRVTVTVRGAPPAPLGCEQKEVGAESAGGMTEQRCVFEPERSYP